MNFLKKFINLLFPIHCVNCNQKYEKHLCNTCLEKIPFERKGKKSDIFFAFSYKNPIVKKALWNLKFYGKKDIAYTLSQKAFDVLLDEMQDLQLFNNLERPLLVPIPLHPKRLKERGFNQSELIAIALYSQSPSLFNIDIKHIVRNRYTKPQARIQNKNERIINVSKCFSITDSNFFKNKNVIIIDDITTTGATIIELKDILIQYGAKSVYGFTIAQ